MGDIIVQIASEVAKYLVAPIGRQLRHLFSYHNVEDLRSQLARLEGKKGRVEQEVIAARRNGDDIEPDVDEWLKSVDGITEDAAKLLDDEDKAKKRCFNGLCPNLKSRYQLSKKAKKTTQKVVRMQEDGKFDRLSYPAPPPRIGHTSIKGYEAFESRMPILKDIMKALSTPSINMIGVYGMGGVGKTTLVKEVAKQAEEDRLFDQVVMAEVSETPDLQKIQGTIADMLGLKFDQASEPGRAYRLRERLKKEKKILVILDNIWGRIDLEAVGIPFGDDHKGCKILLTSRSQEVLCNQMDTQKNFGIGVLPNEEAWNLFKKMAGDSVENPDLQSTASEVTEKCAGLPITIVTVARALKNKPLSAWKDALQQLQASNRPKPGIGHTSIKGYEAFESRMPILKDIMEALSTPSSNMIGVYGMGGVGKTTLVKEVAKQAEEDRLFDQVVMAEVSETPDLKEIRGTIADMLGLKFDKASEHGRADQLRERLKKEKKILVILDNIWGRIDLEAVGIPFGDDHQGCKILLTSRSQEVLCNQMDTQKNFGIGVLPKEEAWKLFKKMAGDSVENPDLQSTASEVTEKCAGLPIAIVTVARALKNKPLSAWKDALQQLQASNRPKISGMEANVYTSLELSYNNLESEELKSLFLLCGLYLSRRSSSVEDLLEYGMGLGLFQDINTLEEARNRIHTLLHNLKASCLLLDSDSTQVKMHDVVLNVAISIASRDQNGFMVRYGVGLKELPHKHLLKNCTAISLLDSNIHELPEWLECPLLKFFLLSSQDPALKVPDTFFKEMKELKVLDLTGIHFSSLPSSLVLLAKLQTLCLDWCVLGDIAVIGELKSLEILSFLGSDIVQLPREIGKLTHLRLLSLRNCSKLRIIPPNVISSLSQLEELWMENSFFQWEAEGPNSQRCNASLDELKNLSCLTALEVHIPNAEILPKGFLFENLIRYRILIGDVWKWPGYIEASRTLKLKLSTSIHLEVGVKMLLERTEDLFLDELMGIKNLLYELDREGFQQLKSLSLQSNYEIQHIINSINWVPCSAFAILEYIFLKNLTSLEEICHGPLPDESFRKLITIRVESCDKLKNLFSLSQARGLLQLQEIEITECNIMVGVVAEEREDEEGINEVMDKISFPQLTILTLRRLPELVSFCSKMNRRQQFSTTDVGSEEIISDAEHDIPIPLFNKKVSFPCLKSLKLSELSKLKQIWHGQSPIESCNIQSLEVEKCPFLLNIAPSNFLQSSQNLESIVVKSCESVEQVLDLEGLNSDEEHAALLSHLVTLELSELPRLKCIWNKDPQGILSFRSLKWLDINNCNSLKTLFPVSMALDLVQLQVIKITNCDVMEDIVEKEKGAREEAIVKIVFPLLRLVLLQCLPNLRSFYPGNHNLECPSLKRMLIDRCPKMKTFTSTNVATPNLEILLLLHVPSLFATWKKDSQGIFPFQNLSKLRVIGSEYWRNVDKIKTSMARSLVLGEHLRSILTTSMAKSLVQLQELTIGHFDDMIEEIIEKEGVEEEATEVIVFPQLTSLILQELAQLKSFCQGIHISKWPSLKKLWVSHCHNVEIVASELISFEETRGKGHLGTPMKQPLFLVDKVAFPNLEEMELVSMLGLKEIWRGQFHAESFFQLRVLNVKWCHEILKVFPVSLLRNLQNLEELSVESCSSLEEVFELEGLVGEVRHASTLSQLRELRLKELPNLMHLWKEDSQLSPVFRNLTTLEVRSCGSLIHLLPSTIAESLLQIKSISVVDCKMMKEIIASEKGEATDEISFNQLKSLELKDLPNLVNFCLGSNTFSFPSLEEVVAEECLKLKTFSNNNVSAPKLEKVQVNDNEWLWDGDLNTTIQHLFIQKNAESQNAHQEV